LKKKTKVEPNWKNRTKTRTKPLFKPNRIDLQEIFSVVDFVTSLLPPLKSYVFCFLN